MRKISADELAKRYCALVGLDPATSWSKDDYEKAMQFAIDTLTEPQEEKMGCGRKVKDAYADRRTRLGICGEDGKRKVRTWTSMEKEFYINSFGSIKGPTNNFTLGMENLLNEDRIISITDDHWRGYRIYDWMLEPLSVYPGEEKQETADHELESFDKNFPADSQSPTRDPAPGEYPWAFAPEWAMWAATDGNKEFYWWDEEPIPVDSSKEWQKEKTASYMVFSGHAPESWDAAENWRELKREKPEVRE